MKKVLFAAALLTALLAPRSYAQEASAAWKKEMESRISILTEELEKIRLGGSGAPAGAPLEALPVSQYSFGPGAAKVYGHDKGFSFAGYGELIYQGFSHSKADSLVDNEKRASEIDLARMVLYTGYRFSDRIVFDSELEVEHANSSKSGEVGAEFAFLDFALSKPIGFRVGKLLMPVGLTNEYHEPIVFHGALRPESEKFIIPTTWAENGAGYYGQLGPWAYRGYVTAGLRAAGDAKMNQDGMQPDIGLLESRQEGSRSRAQNLAYVQRLDFSGLPGLSLGASVFTGDAGQGDVTPAGARIHAPVTLWDAHLRGEYRGFEVRALYVQATVGGGGEINQANGLAGAQSVGQFLWGGYVEGAYNALGRLLPSTSQYAAPFFRYERLNTQGKVPPGFSSDPANDRTTYTLGMTYRPIPRIALKADYQIKHDHGRAGINQFNLASGYEF